MISIKRIAAVMAAGFLLCACTPAKEPEKEEEPVLPKIVLTPEHTEMEAPAKVVIAYEIVPEEYADDVEITGIQNSGVYIQKKDGKMLFQTDNPGYYTVSLQGVYTDEEGRTFDITSNDADIYVKRPKKEENQENTSSKSPESSEKTDENQSDDSQNSDQTNEESEIFVQPISVDEAIDKGETIIETDKEITIEGLLPQALVEVEDGSLQAVIWNNNQTKYIILDNADVLDIGGTRAQLLGTLSLKDGAYHFKIRKFRQLKQQ